MTALKYQLVLSPVPVCHNHWHPIWMLKVPFGITPPMPNASQQSLHPKHPAMMHRLYIALVRFGHKTAMTFGYVHEKITPGRSVQPVWQWQRWFHIADTLKSCAFLSDLFSCSLSVLLLQVNSDKIYWQRNADGTFSQIFSEKNTVGHFISTKAVGSDERNDITHLYKYPEGLIKWIAQTEMFI